MNPLRKLRWNDGTCWTGKPNDQLGRGTGIEELALSGEASHRRVAGTVQEHRQSDADGRQQRVEGYMPVGKVARPMRGVSRSGGFWDIAEIARIAKIAKISGILTPIRSALGPCRPGRAEVSRGHVPGSVPALFVPHAVEVFSPQIAKTTEIGTIAELAEFPQSPTPGSTNAGHTYTRNTDSGRRRRRPPDRLDI